MAATRVAAEELTTAVVLRAFIHVALAAPALEAAWTQAAAGLACGPVHAERRALQDGHAGVPVTVQAITRSAFAAIRALRVHTVMLTRYSA